MWAGPWSTIATRRNLDLFSSVQSRLGIPTGVLFEPEFWDQSFRLLCRSPHNMVKGCVRLGCPRNGIEPRPQTAAKFKALLNCAAVWGRRWLFREFSAEQIELRSQPAHFSDFEFLDFRLLFSCTNQHRARKAQNRHRADERFSGAIKSARGLLLYLRRSAAISRTISLPPPQPIPFLLTLDFRKRILLLFSLSTRARFTSEQDLIALQSLRNSLLACYFFFYFFFPCLRLWRVCVCFRSDEPF